MSRRLRSAAGIALSTLVLSGVIVIAAVYGLGLRTSYGNGIDSRLGGQIQRDFLADQDAEAAALTSGDASLINSRLTDAALDDVLQQIGSKSAPGATLNVSYQPASLTILRASDPADASLVIEVQEDGTKTVTTSAGPDSAPSQQSISFHGDFWLRPISGRYAIADQNIQLQPSSQLASLGLSAAALAVVGIAAALFVRRRMLLAPIPTLPPTPAENQLPELTEPEDVEPALEPDLPAAEVVIRTFGGLQVRQDGKDWAAALSGRPVASFVWRRLLVAAIRDPHARPTREEIGRQASPRHDREFQLKQMRNFIHQGLPDLPPAVKDRLVVEPQVLWFKLEGAEVDAVTLLTICAESAGRRSLTKAQIARGRRVLEATGDVFLPEFESVDDIATDHHPTCGDLIREVRNLLGVKRAELAIGIATSHLASNRTTAAITVLERAYTERPESADLAASLASAYLRAGRKTDAEAIEPRLATGRA